MKAGPSSSTATLPQTYALDWQIVNGHTFVSRGVTYKWYAPHR